jgi:hypothetical protein
MAVWGMLANPRSQLISGFPSKQMQTMVAENTVATWCNMVQQLRKADVEVQKTWRPSSTVPPANQHHNHKHQDLPPYISHTQTSMEPFQNVTNIGISLQFGRQFCIADPGS